MPPRHDASPKTIAIAGSSGLVGSALIPALTNAGHTVKRLVRQEPRHANEIRWSPDEGTLDATTLTGVDAVVNLAGEPIVGRWTPEKKHRITASRVNATRLLAETLAKLEPRPAVLINASAIGYYGSRGDEELDETSTPGQGFLAESCKAWEAATQPASDAGIRTVILRIGLVLSTQGGALAKMLPIFRAGIAGPLGNGRQWWSWVALHDVVGVIEHALHNQAVAGPVNTTAPQPVTNKAFTKTLGQVLRRPTLLPVPRVALRLVLGEMADDTMFASAKVMPRMLQQTSYPFTFTELEPTLRHMLHQ